MKRVEEPEIQMLSMDEVQRWILEILLSRGTAVRPRGMKTLELTGVSFCLAHPRRRCITNRYRKWSLPLAIGEFCWHASGSNKLSGIEYYARHWREFTDDPCIIRGSCYGHRIFNRKPGGQSQWDRVVGILREDPDSRRAILSLYDQDIGLDSAKKDVPCACTVQFMIRAGKIQTIVHMRSNDAVWGLPYDVFLFTMLQELLALRLGVDLGKYFHIVGSLHVYERHFALARRIIDSAPDSPFEMPMMTTPEQLGRFLDGEEALRLGNNPSAVLTRELSDYWRNLLEVLEWLREAKLAGGYETVINRIPGESPYADLLHALVGSPRNLELA